MVWVADDFVVEVFSFILFLLVLLLFLLFPFFLFFAWCKYEGLRSFHCCVGALGVSTDKLVRACF